MNHSGAVQPQSQSPRDAPEDGTGGSRRQHDAVRQLRERLAELGLPKDQVRQILPVTDMQRRPYVRLGTWTVDNAEKLLDAITSAPEQVP
ncbi:hypothetical protein AB0M29_17625 [Streptomyces sp. NPDC051976]|uniref:hypothetical protein n=1 Tax=Streptomyces sp. NPDC051976 TaxID=3154947 RepID=UPI00342DDF7F